MFLGRNQLMQCLSFDDVPGSASSELNSVRSLSIGREAPGSDNLLVRDPLTQLVASLGSLVALWRLDAMNMAKMEQLPVYARWRLDGTLPMRGQLVSSLALWDGTPRRR